MKNILLFLLAGCMAMHAQNRLSGTVSAEGAVLPGATISLPELHQSTITDENGVFEFKNLPGGQLVMIISATGFETQNKTVSASGSQPLEIVLMPNLHELDEIVVSTPFRRLQRENVTKVDYYDIEELVQRSTTLHEALATLPGISQVTTGAAIGKPVIRGLSGNRVLVYSQGIRLENQQFGDEHGLGLSESGMGSVEIIKGPSSLLYGSDALGGVLYFNPERFAKNGQTEADFSQKLLSNTLGSVTSAGFRTSSDAFKFLVRGSHASHADYQVAGGDRVTNTRFQETDFKTALGFNSGQYSGVLRYNFNRLNTGIPEEGIGFQSEDRSPLDPRQDIFNHMISLQNSLFFENSKLESTLGFTHNNRQEIEDGEKELWMKLRTLHYDIKYYLPKWGATDIIAGIQGMAQNNENFGEKNLIPDATVADLGVFTTAQYERGRHLVQIGLRYDHRAVTGETMGVEGAEGFMQGFSRNFNAANFSAGHKFAAGAFTLRTNVATGFRSPNLAELGSNGVHHGTNRFVRGNASLKNEQNFQTDISLDYDTEHWDFFINGFYNRIANYIYLSPSGEQIDEYFVFDYLQDDATLFGGEVGIHFHPHPLDFLHFETTFETVTAQRTNGEALPLIPANNLNNAVRVSFNSAGAFRNLFARADVSTFFDQRRNGRFEAPTGGYTLLHLSAGGEITFGRVRTELSLTANNLLDRRYVSHLSRLRPENIPDMGRNLILSLKFHL